RIRTPDYASDSRSAAKNPAPTCAYTETLVRILSCVYAVVYAQIVQIHNTRGAREMAIKRGYRFPIEFSTAFPRQLLLMCEIGPAIKYNPDRNAVQEQEYDFNPKTGEGTGLPLWKATVTDPNEGNHDGNKGKAKRASFEITFISSHQPVPVTEEVVPGTGLRMIELEGLTAEPRVMGQGEF